MNPKARAILFAWAHVTAAILAFASPGQAQQDWYVDRSADCMTSTGSLAAPYCTIMEAISAAADGDTIRIAPGTYHENVLIDRDLTLIGTGGQAVTILDGMASGSVVRVRDSAATLMGLTLTNGTGTSYGTSGYSYGGGLFIYSPSGLGLPVSVVGSSLIDNDAGRGGGVANGGPGVAGSPLTLTCSTVSANDSGGIVGGGGICTYASLEVLASAVEFNVGGYGGGIVSHAGFAVSISDSSVCGNQGTYFPRNAGGISVLGTLTVLDSDISNNRGDAVGALSAGGTMTLKNSTVRGNHGWVSVDGSGGLALTNTLVSSNNGYIGNAAVYAYGTLTARNSTIAGNSNGGIAMDSGHADLANTIVWGNAGPPITLYSSTALVEYSLIEGGWPGAGNIDRNPMFADRLQGDFRLTTASPCIDAGNNLLVPGGITTDIRGLPRFVDAVFVHDTGFGGPPTVDMGAYELQPPGLPPAFGHKRRAPNAPFPYAPPRVIR